MPVLSDALGRSALNAKLVVIAAALAIWVWLRQRLLEQGYDAGLDTPADRSLTFSRRRLVCSHWSCLAQGPGCRQGRFKAKRQAAKAKALTTSSDILMFKPISNAALDRRIDRWMRD